MNTEVFAYNSIQNLMKS